MHFHAQLVLSVIDKAVKYQAHPILVSYEAQSAEIHSSVQNIPVRGDC